MTTRPGTPFLILILSLLLAACQAVPNSDWRDATSELRGRCLLDCAKVILTTYRDLTIVLLRAGSPEKAKVSVLRACRQTFLTPPRRFTSQGT